MCKKCDKKIPKMKTTKDGKSYWGGNGVYEKEYAELRKKLVPDQGKAETMHGELLRCIGNLTYEWGNNGNGNAVDTVTEDCPECGGSGWEERGTGEYEGEDGEGDEIMEDVDCSVCGGNCTIEKGKEFDGNHWEEQFEYIKDNLPKEFKPLAQKLIDLVLEELDEMPNDKGEYKIYNDVADAIVYTCLTTENKPR